MGPGLPPQLLRLPGRALAAPAHHRRGRVDLCHRQAATAGHQGRRLTDQGPADGFQAPRHGAETLATSQGSAPRRTGQRRSTIHQRNSRQESCLIESPIHNFGNTSSIKPAGKPFKLYDLDGLMVEPLVPSTPTDTPLGGSAPAHTQGDESCRQTGSPESPPRRLLLQRRGPWRDRRRTYLSPGTQPREQTPQGHRIHPHRSHTG